MKVMLVKEASGSKYSIEAGIADGQYNFDHHKPEHRLNPAPCADGRIAVIAEDAVVEITHMDADTYIGLLRMSGKKLPKLDFGLMEKIDLNGSSVCADKFNPTILYMVGVTELARIRNFPRASEMPIDVTEKITEMMGRTTEEIVVIGKIATDSSESTYQNSLVVKKGKVGLWAVGANDSMDPSRPYEDGIDVVVIYRNHYKSISIYCNPISAYAFGGKKICGVQFAGHEKACGSPRGVEMTEEDAKRVFEEIVKRLSESL